MKIQFGKYKGKELDKVPRSYLRWLDRKAGTWIRRRYPYVFRYINENLVHITAKVHQQDNKKVEAEGGEI